MSENDSNDEEFYDADEGFVYDSPSKVQSMEDSSPDRHRRLKQRSGLVEMFAANDRLAALRDHPVVRVLPGGALFSPPAQRQMWGDKQVLPHINWADLFFDLFYVSAAYNLAGIYKYSLDGRSILYFLGCFGPIMLNWTDKTHYNARFEVPNDAVHRYCEILELCVLALTTLHIQPVKRMSNSVMYADMFVFSVGLLMCNFFILLRYIEIGFVWVNGGPEAKVNGRRLLTAKLAPTVFYATAAVVAMIFRHNGTDNSDIPICLCLGGWIGQDVIYFYQFDYTLPDDGSHKEMVVPMNVHYMIHRYGEWTMLILGESVLSLLTADIAYYDGSLFYVSFFSGILSVILLQYLHYKSQPLHAKDHALCSHKRQGILFIFFTQVYSASLTLVGASYKLFMLEHKEKATEQNYRFLIEYINKNDAETLVAGFLSGSSPHANIFRKLSDGNFEETIDGSISEDHQSRIAKFFCISLAFAWLSLDLIILTHKGLSASIRRVTSEQRKYHLRPVFFVILRVSLIGFIASLGFYANDPDLVCVVGLVGILAQVILRKVGKLIFYAGGDNDSQSLHLQRLQENEIPTLG